jgi:hypothetical protein
MSALLSALAVLLALLAGAYIVSVLRRTIDWRTGRIGRAALSPLAEAASLLRQEDWRPGALMDFCSSPPLWWPWLR